MRHFRRRTAKGLILIAVGAYATQVACLPKDYWWKFAATGQTVILSAFAETVFTTITDTLFPGTADDGGDTTN